MCSAGNARVGRSWAGLARPWAASARMQKHVEMMFDFIMVEVNACSRIVFGCCGDEGFECMFSELETRKSGNWAHSFNLWAVYSY